MTPSHVSRLIEDTKDQILMVLSKPTQSQTLRSCKAEAERLIERIENLGLEVIAIHLAEELDDALYRAR